jgi:thiol-disulfide isomerase/thioredoxin
MLKIKTLMLAFLILSILLFLSGCTSNNTSNNNTNNDSDDSNWLENYTPVHGIGTGSDDFWIIYPPGNPSSGQSVNHLNWVNNSLKKGSVLFVVHKTGCPYCKEQADRVIAFADKYTEQIEFYDLDIPLGGDIEQMANDAYLYDPDGPPGYIALTGVFTYVEDNGEIKIGWHSWELDVEDSVMESWIKDAIYYYNMNNKG